MNGNGEIAFTHIPPGFFLKAAHRVEHALGSDVEHTGVTVDRRSYSRRFAVRQGSGPGGVRKPVVPKQRLDHRYGDPAIACRDF